MSLLFPSRFLLAAAVLLGACTGGGSSSDTAPVASTESMTRSLSSTVVFTRSGGIAGYDDRVEISSDGTVHALSAGKISQTKLSASELATLASLLDAAKSFDATDTATPEGADMIAYTLVYDDATIHANDLTDSAELRDTMDFLADLLSP